MAAEAGFDVHIRADRIRHLAGAVRSKASSRRYLIGWSGRVDIDGNTYAFLHSQQAQNVGAYTNPTVDKLLDEARGMTDVAQRKALYAQMMTQECAGPADHLSVDAAQHRRHVGEAARASARCPTA